MDREALTVTISLLTLLFLLRLEFCSRMEAKWTGESQSTYQEIREAINDVSEGQIITIPVGIYAVLRG